MSSNQDLEENIEFVDKVTSKTKRKKNKDPTKNSVFKKFKQKVKSGEKPQRVKSVFFGGSISDTVCRMICQIAGLVTFSYFAYFYSN